jgi:hypothetical protein
VRTLIIAAAVALATAAVFAQASKNFRGLDISVGGVERAGNVSLTDCPPGANTVSSTAKPGEEFAGVSLKMKVTPG